MKVKSKRIFYIITSLDYGGTQKQLYILLKTILETKEFNYEIFLISLKKNGRFRKKFTALNIKIYDLCLSENNLVFNLLVLPLALLKLIFLFFYFQPNIVHSFLFQANIFAKILKVLNPKVKLICSERVAEKQKKWQSLISRITNFLVDKFTVNSYDLKNFISISQKIKKEKIYVIHNTFLKEDFKVNLLPYKIRSYLGINENDFLVISVGRLHKQKGFDLFLDIVKKFVEEVKLNKYKRDFLFLILGDGKDKKFLINYAKVLNVLSYVRFLGYIENIYDYINSCDLFILTSYWEGSPNVILEALYFKKPVISTGVEGVKDYLDKNYIISLNNKREDIVANFVSKIMRFYLGEVKDYKECINKNFEIDFYNSEKIIKIFKKIYQF
ncbi:MAG: glycosyltransferase [Endomicrobia bacterium]|nr:glycosyltransferase [Endomicrobiia bacterium]